MTASATLDRPEREDIFNSLEELVIVYALFLRSDRRRLNRWDGRDGFRIGYGLGMEIAS